MGSSLRERNQLNISALLYGRFPRAGEPSVWDVAERQAVTIEGRDVTIERERRCDVGRSEERL